MALFSLLLLYDTPSSILLRWDEEVEGFPKGTGHARRAFVMAPFDRLVVGGLKEAHHTTVVPWIVLANPLLRDRISEKDDPSPEGIPLLEMAQGALQEEGLVLDQPLNRVV